MLWESQFKAEKGRGKSQKRENFDDFFTLHFKSDRWNIWDYVYSCAKQYTWFFKLKSEGVSGKNLSKYHGMAHTSLNFTLKKKYKPTIPKLLKKKTTKREI